MFKNLNSLKNVWDKSFLNSSDNWKWWKAGAITKWSPAKALFEDRLWGGEIPGILELLVKGLQNARSEQISKHTISLIAGFGQTALPHWQHCWGTALKSLVRCCQDNEFTSCIAHKDWQSLVRDLLPWAQAGCTQSYLLLIEKPLTGWSGILNLPSTANKVRILAVVLSVQLFDDTTVSRHRWLWTPSASHEAIP